MKKDHALSRIQLSYMSCIQSVRPVPTIRTQLRQGRLNISFNFFLFVIFVVTNNSVFLGIMPPKNTSYSKPRTKKMAKKLLIESKETRVSETISESSREKYNGTNQRKMVKRERQMLRKRGRRSFPKSWRHHHQRG